MFISDKSLPSLFPNGDRLQLIKDGDGGSLGTATYSDGGLYKVIVVSLPD